MRAKSADANTPGLSQIRDVPHRILQRIRLHYSPSSCLFVSVAVLGILLVFTGLVAHHYFDKDPVTSLSYIANDGFCRTELSEGLGVHCFSDYQFVVRYTSQPNPWDEVGGLIMNYPAAGMLPHAFFGAVGKHSGSANAGLFGYLALLTAALVVPAFWASKGKPASIRVVTVGLFGLFSVPSLMALDRGNSIALVVPPVLAFLVSLRREAYRVTVLSIVLAAMVKPQYALLLLVLLALRKWRLAAISFAGVVVTNLLAFLVWPTGFPGTIRQAVSNVLGSGSTVSLNQDFPANASLSKGLHVIEKAVRSILGSGDGGLWVDSHAPIAGAVAATLICGAIVVAGRHIPAFLSGIIVVMCVSLVPSTSWSYYLVFALPVAAIILRDPLGEPIRDRWRGVLDTLNTSFGKGIANVLLVATTALTVSRVLLPSPVILPGSPRTDLVATSADIIPALWIVTAVVVLLVWWRPAGKVAASPPNDESPPTRDDERM